MNAYDMMKAIEESQTCDGLKEWLETELFPRMCNSSSMSVRINTRDVRWNREQFIREMENLGYTMDYDCEDRPCSEPYYTISIKIKRNN